MGEQTEMSEQKQPVRRKNTKIGTVTSNSMNKSVVVSVDRFVRHGLYAKTRRRTSTFMAHDEGNQCNVGDKVEIEECRPISRRKRWLVSKILVKAL